MFNTQHYVPVLKWRQGEYLALSRLSEDVKNMVTPFFELPTEAWDFENEQPAKSIDEHLEKFGSRLREKWGSRRCFVDSPFYEGSTCVASGKHHLEHVFDLARAAEANAVPVLGLERDERYISAVHNITTRDHQGMCLRLTADDFEPTLAEKIAKLLATLNVAAANCDLVVDCAEGIGESSNAQGLVWKALLDLLPAINHWRSLTLVSSAFPASLPAATFRPTGLVRRGDWLGYKALLKLLPPGYRRPTFGDYGVTHPRTEMIDPRMMDPNAKIKYTTDNAWFIALGVQVKKYGRGQYTDICRAILNADPRVFEGREFSFGDNYIDQCANHNGSTGNASTWPMVASNHHITKVVRDVANLSAV